MARKPRRLGTPTIIVHVMPATPEKVEQTRKDFKRALENMYGTRLNVDFGEKPEGYGVDYTMRPQVGGT